MRVKKFLRTDCQTLLIKTVEKKKINASLMVGVSFYELSIRQPEQKYFSFKEIQAECLRNNYVLELVIYSNTARNLAGVNMTTVKRLRGDFLIRKKATRKDKEMYGWSSHTQYKYAYNPAGSSNFREALLSAYYNNVTEASIVA